MATDVHGWVEVRSSEDGQWTPAIHIDEIVHRQNGMFASLFGVRNGDKGSTAADGRFRAIAPSRGVPPKASEAYITEREAGDAEDETWIAWSEVANINWDEEGAYYTALDPPYTVFATSGPGRQRERRRDYLTGGWVTLFNEMRLLAKKFGANNVRLSVWFD